MEVSHQPDCEGPDNHGTALKMCLFIPIIKEMPGQSVKQLQATLEMTRGGADS